MKISRVAKCQIFYTEQNHQTKFYPKKSMQIATILALKLNKTNKMDIFGEQLLAILPNQASLYTKILHTLNKFCEIGCFPKLLPPTCQYFYTDISVISVTFRNSGTNKQKLKAAAQTDKTGSLYNGLYLNLGLALRRCWQFVKGDHETVSFLPCLWTMKQIGPKEFESR